jgi:hypothetical protein
MGVKLLDKMPEIERQKEYFIKGFESDTEPSKFVCQKYSYRDKTSIDIELTKLAKLINQKKTDGEFIDAIEDLDAYNNCLQNVILKRIKSSVISFDGEKIIDFEKFYDSIPNEFVIKQILESIADINAEESVAQAAKN